MGVDHFHNGRYFVSYYLKKWFCLISTMESSWQLAITLAVRQHVRKRLGIKSRLDRHQITKLPSIPKLAMHEVTLTRCDKLRQERTKGLLEKQFPTWKTICFNMIKNSLLQKTPSQAHQSHNQHYLLNSVRCDRKPRSQGSLDRFDKPQNSKKASLILFGLVQEKQILMLIVY